MKGSSLWSKMEFETETQFNSLGKRLRNDDSATFGHEWDEQPRHRKLVFRTPSVQSDIFISQDKSSQQNPHTPTLVPADSSSDSSNAEIRSPPLGPSVAVPSTVFTPADDDIDMEMDGPSTPHNRGQNSPMVSPKSQTPTRPSSRESRHGRLAPIMLGTPNQSHDLSTRVPTPIYGHFSTHGGDVSAAQVPPNTGSPLPHHSRSNHYNIALYPQHNLQERKMPSPISEDFAPESRDLNSGQRQYLAQMQHLQATHLGIHVDEDMAMSPSSPTAPVLMSRSPSVGQRRRSDAISGSPGDGLAAEMARHGSNQSAPPTTQPQPMSCHQDGTAAGQRASFHMGFKADCKMCQDRVPGHFNHITHARA